MRWLQLFALFLFHCAVAQTTDWKAGQLYNSIPVEGQEGETFALYLPKTFSSNSLSPIVFIFDPAARGSVGIRPFVAAADKYEYILVCSNNSRNGPYGENLDIADRLFKHIFNHFNIAEKRIYTAGFSGGARLASTIAVLSDAMQGVIGCGAGFSKNPTHFPRNGQSFSYVGLVGDRDMNYRELQQTKDWLNTLGIDNELFIYEDDHRWPPSEQILRAFEWLELQAYKKNLKKSNPEIIANSYQKTYSLAASHLNNQKSLDAAAELDRILNNYEGYFTIDSIVDKAKMLKKSKAYKKAVKDQKRLARVEDTLSRKFLARFGEEQELGYSPDQFQWWQKQLKKLDEEYIGSNNELYQKMGKRLRYQLFALTIETFEIHVRKKELPQADYCAALLLTQSPENSFFNYRLALGYAKLEAWDKSLSYLESAAKYGWENKAQWQEQKEFQPIWKHARFLKLMAQQ